MLARLIGKVGYMLDRYKFLRTAHRTPTAFAAIKYVHWDPRPVALRATPAGVSC
jgi:hypothetical protein